MKIIIDECVPSIIKASLIDRDIVTVQEMGWAGVKNGELLRLIVAQFDVFITSDKNLRHQQNLPALDVIVILLPSNRVPVVNALLGKLDTVLATIGEEKYLEL
jgi:hypothetical protein